MIADLFKDIRSLMIVYEDLLRGLACSPTSADRWNASKLSWCLQRPKSRKHTQLPNFLSDRTRHISDYSMLFRVCKAS